MKKIIIAIYLCLFTSVVAAEHEMSPPDMPQEFNGMFWTHVPVICGTTDRVKSYLEEYGFELDYMAMGRRGAKPNGEPVYMVSHFLNEKLDQAITVITAPSGLESCMMYKAFDVTYPGKTT